MENFIYHPMILAAFLLEDLGNNVDWSSVEEAVKEYNETGTATIVVLDD